MLFICRIFGDALKKSIGHANVNFTANRTKKLLAASL